MQRDRKSPISPRSTKSSTRRKVVDVTNLEYAEKVFDYYYNIGPERNLLILEKKTGISFDILKQWSEALGWDEKVSSMNKELDRSFETYYKNKSRDIRNRLVRQMENLLGEMEGSSLGLPFAIKDVQDFRNLANAYESLVRANTLAMTRAVEGNNDEAPTTWADLLKASQNETQGH